MDNTTKFLLDWTFHYIKNKDLILKKIVNIQEHVNQNYILVEYKDKKMIYYVEPFLEDVKKTIKEIEEHKKTTNSTDSCLVVFNEKENLGKVVQNWDSLDTDPKFQMIFANPFSTTDKRWIIIPYTHSRITEKTALKTGLQTLYNGVDTVTKESVERMIKKE